MLAVGKPSHLPGSLLMDLQNKIFEWKFSEYFGKYLFHCYFGSAEDQT